MSNWCKIWPMILLSSIRFPIGLPFVLTGLIVVVSCGLLEAEKSAINTPNTGRIADWRLFYQRLSEVTAQSGSMRGGYQPYNDQSTLDGNTSNTYSVEEIGVVIASVTARLHEFNSLAQNRSARSPLTFLVASDTTYNWASDDWHPVSRTTNTYAGGALVSELREVWNGTAWVNSANAIYSYDINGYSSIYRYQSWQEDAWVDQYRLVFTYNSALVVTILNEFWNGSVWSNSFNTVLTYDSSSRLETNVSQQWTGGLWVNLSKFEYTYDGNGDQTLSLLQTWLADTWVNHSREVSVYDEHHQETSLTLQTWDIGNSAWGNSHRNEFEYDQLGNQTLIQGSHWGISGWALSRVDSMNYSNSNKIIQGITLTVTGSDSNYFFQYQARHDYDYNGSDNLVLDLGYYYFEENWNPISREVWAYTTNVCGDANGSGAVNISDAVFLINYIFSGGPAPNPLESGDADCSGLVTISDVVFLINYIFAGGLPPCAACQERYP